MATVKNNDNKKSLFFHRSTTFSFRTEDEVFRNLTHLGKNIYVWDPGDQMTAHASEFAVNARQYISLV